VDLEVGDEEVVAIVGASGCGKTTLLRMVAGLTTPTQGAVHVDGRHVWHDGRPDREVIDRLAVVFQDPNLLPWFSIEDNIALPLRMRGVARPERLAKARELCAFTGLAGFEKMLPAALSGGMRQRAALARALVASPRLVLLDEPFASLDALTRDAMNLELQRIWQQKPSTTIVVTHSIAEAVMLADRVIALTPRPARIAGTVDVGFDRPRSLELQGTSTFQELVGRVRGHLQDAS
ncbi:MAG TPA: ABC transporter ATP-binding protein, partial [Acidimicrobiales bacterium]|nr:ABC transporter ATP-binding protein [Acidimicrobiales bacterium]